MTEPTARFAAASRTSSCPDRLMPVWRALRQHPTSALVWLQLAHGYAQRGWPWHAQYAHTQALRCAQASGHGAVPNPIPTVAEDCWGEGASSCLGRLQAWSGLQRVRTLLQCQTESEPLDWLSWLFLARCLEMEPGFQADRPGAAHWQQAMAQAKQLELVTGETGHLLAQWRLAAGDAQGALAALHAVLHQSPRRYSSWVLQGQTQMQLGLKAAAGQSFERASHCTNPKLLLQLAGQLLQHGLTAQALRVGAQAVWLSPSDPQVWLLMAQTQRRSGQLTQARHSVEQALGLQPAHQAALHQRAEIQSALYSREYFERERARFDEDPLQFDAQQAAHLLRTSLFQSDMGPLDVADLHRRVGQHMAQQALATRPQSTPWPAPQPWCNPQGQVRRLRVGYVCGELHAQHPIWPCFLPVLAQHDRSCLDVFVYGNGPKQLRELGAHRRDTAALDDVALHQCIVQDQIDVLVDLVGHNSAHRLGVFALRAAPVQLSYLGYPHSTGLPFMDAMVVDDVLVPPALQHLFTEQLARVSGSALCWQAPGEYPLPPAPARARARSVVFGAFTPLHTMNDAVVAVWARILRQCPGAVLLLRAKALADPDSVRDTCQRFAVQGVPACQLDLRAASDPGQEMQDHLDVDIVLDPFPFNGDITSLQALWMGCALVSLEGGHMASRRGAMLLHQMGRTQWLAHSADDYVAKALVLVRQMREQPWSRQALRKAMQASGLCDAEHHTRELEALYLQAFFRSSCFH